MRPRPVRHAAAHNAAAHNAAVRYAVVEAPSGLGLRATGVERMPDALLGNGLADRLGARRAGRVPAPAPTGEIHPGTRVLHGGEIAAWAPRLADAVTATLDEGDVPVVLGGDCSILLGTALALRRRGRYGLLFVDGHDDFYDPATDPSGEAASMDLALVTGHGPALLTDLEGLRPLVRPGDVVTLGARDAAEQARSGCPPPDPAIVALALPTLRRLGAGAAARVALEQLTRTGLDGFLVHVDADCLDDDVMPAVDYRQPGGLTPAELTTLLRRALATERVAALQVTVYNPTLDPDGFAGRTLTDLLVDALTQPSPPPATPTTTR